ncbi:N(6)-adenine-specific methyltransferase METTL4 [Amia ocellicauda]|uniref:N(6)-adenine-specific methyltransferase METTL4 n=1 Tax=Amia ocellicauda TaxID=2972642 RepID=UPI003464CC41
MSVVFKNTKGWLLDQRSHINKSFQSCLLVKDPGLKQYVQFSLKRKYFDILKPHILAKTFTNLDAPGTVHQESKSNEESSQTRSEDTLHLRVRCKKRKRKHKERNQGEIDSESYHEKVRKIILEGTKSLVEEGFTCDYLYGARVNECHESLDLTMVDSRLADLCEMAKKLPIGNGIEQGSVQTITEDQTSTELDLFECITQNNMDCARLVTLMGEKYLLPPHCSFLLSDISRMQPLVNSNERYDVIVLDPPWENKSVKRSKRYSSLPPSQLKRIPVPELAAQGCLLLTWVTNRQKHLRFVKEELYPHWSVEVLAEWLWVKITNSGEYVFPIDSPHKKPYEILVLGRHCKTKDASSSSPVKDENPLPDHKIIVSVPSTLHSQKPSLADVLEEYVDPEAKCLELFARNLQPGWTSWGNEVIKFQHLSYFNMEETGPDSLT